MTFQHHEFAEGKWLTLSLMEQLGNVGSEISRAKNWQGKNEQYFENSVFRALELLDLTMADPRWIKTKRLKEICRAREVVCDAYLGGHEYGSTLEDLDEYFLQFAIAARLNT